MEKFSDVDNVRSELLARIKEEVPENIYSLWFEKLSILRFDENAVYICVPTEMIQQAIGHKYRTLISNILKRLYNVSPQINLYNTQYGEIDINKIIESAHLEKNTKTVLPAANPSITNTDNRVKLRGKYTFANFIVGKSNEFAYTACTVVARDLESPYNPLFIYGPSGIGKTHLLYAVTNSLINAYPNKNIVYVNCEEFTTQFIDAVRDPSRSGHSAQSYKKKPKIHIEEFKELYRSCDVLLIDDIQFLEGKESTQEEFFYTFNYLYENGKQIILTSDRSPREIDLEERLITRFEQGLFVDIQPPDIDLRAAIFKYKAENMHISLDNDVLFFLAENINKNVRQIEGVLKKLTAYSFVSSNAVISLELVKQTITDILKGTEPISITTDKIIKSVSVSTGISVEEIKGRKRTKEIAFARHLAIYIMRKITDLSLPSIGKIFNRNHSTILSACDSLENEIKHNLNLEMQVKEILQIIDSR